MKIGIFDSGIGGLSVLHQAMLTLPEADYIFYADVDHVPYGEKTREEVREFVDHAVGFLVNKGGQAIVLACNTATMPEEFYSSGFLISITVVVSLPFFSHDKTR